MSHTMRPIRRIAVNTGGGDAPGLNAVIRAVALSGLKRGWEVIGIRNGYYGLLEKGDSGLLRLDAAAVKGLTSEGGTILGANNRGSPFNLPSEDGTVADSSAHVVDKFREHCLDALVAIGGDGSLAIARKLYEQYDFPVVGVPKTIDNDLAATLYTFGFDTAVATAAEALDKLHTTAESHQRVMVVELMGRYAGWIALYAGLAGSADVILLPEIPFRLESVYAKIRQREDAGRHFSIVVAAEGASPEGGKRVVRQDSKGERKEVLGGIAEYVAAQIQRNTGKETRTLVLGHLQRGGPPTAFDRMLALRFGAAAVRLVEQCDFGKMVALTGEGIAAVTLEQATRELRRVPVDSDMVQTARDLGICLGD